MSESKAGFDLSDMNLVFQSIANKKELAFHGRAHNKKLTSLLSKSPKRWENGGQYLYKNAPRKIRKGCDPERKKKQEKKKNVLRHPHIKITGCRLRNKL